MIDLGVCSSPLLLQFIRICSGKVSWSESFDWRYIIASICQDLSGSKQRDRWSARLARVE